MKPRILVISLLVLFGSGCTSTADKQRLTWRVEPAQSIRHGAPNAQSYYELGRYYQGQGRLGQAEDAYQKAIAIDDRYLDAFNAMGSLYAQRGELERAAQMFEKLAAILPDAPYFHNNLGFAYFLLGRQDDAYASVRKALALDGTLERGWANLENIAKARRDESLLAAVATRKLESLPPAMGAAVPAALPEAPASSPANPETAPAGGKFVVVTSASRPEPFEEIRTQERRDTVLESGFVQTSLSEAASSLREVAKSHAEPLTARVEVSNANGVPRFATRFGANLRNDKIRVTRITNYDSFALQQTVVEYQPGFDADAERLIRQTRLDARRAPASKPRAGADIRIVLGRDAVLACKSGCGAPEGRSSVATGVSEDSTNG